MARIRVCKVSELPPGEKKSVKVNDEVVLVINYEGKIHAVSGICTHEYAELEHGFVTEGAITCPLHLSRFDLSTGEVLSPPAEEPLKKYEVIVEGEEIYVEV